jgi:hypothetical protein
MNSLIDDKTLFNDLNKYLCKNKAPNGSFIFGKDILKFNKNRNYSPTIFVYKKTKFIKNKNVKEFNSKTKKTLSILSRKDQPFFFKGDLSETLIDPYLIEKQRLKELRESKMFKPISEDIKETSLKILNNPQEYDFFRENIALIKASSEYSFTSKNFLYKSIEELTLLNIQHFLFFKDYQKKIIWHLTMEKNLISFGNLLNILKNNPDFLKDFYYKKLKIFLNNTVNGDRMSRFLFRSKNSLNENIEFFIYVKDSYGLFLTKDSLVRYSHESFEFIESFIIKKINDYKKSINNEIIIEKSQYNISEVNSIYDLVKTSFEMNNCVKSYNLRINRKKGRLFKITVNNKKYLALLVKNDKNNIYSKEFKGHSNSEVTSPEALYLLNTLVSEMNTFHRDEFSCKEDPNIFNGRVRPFVRIIMVSSGGPWNSMFKKEKDLSMLLSFSDFLN